MKKGTLKHILRCLMAALMILVMVGCQSDGAGETEPSGAGEQLQATDTVPESTAADGTDPSQVVTVPIETTKAAEPDETKPTETNPAPVDPPATEPKQTTPVHTHSYSASNTVAATCTSNGYTTYTCSCGASYNDNTVSATGHNWGSWSTTKEATTSAEGQQTRKCSNCSTTESQTIAKLPAPEVTLDYAAAEAYGNQYAVDTYGWYINLELNADNAGYYPATTGSVQGFIDRGGQNDLNQRVADKIDALYSNLSAYGSTEGCAINCDVYDNGAGRIYILVYYG